jgi:hypothetical protein
VAGLALTADRRPVIGILLETAAFAIKPVAIVALPFVGLLWAGSRASVRTRVLRWGQILLVAVPAFLDITVVVGTGIGWVNALSTPGTVTTWLSPPSAVAMTIGAIGEAIGLGDHTDGTLVAVRAVALVVAAGIAAWLCLKPEGRSPVRGAVLAMVAVIALGPTFQTWYLLWVLPLAAASGLSARWLRVVLLLIVGGTLYSLCETSATADNLLDVNDGVAMVVTLVVVAVAVLASRRERQLILGDPVSHGLLPQDAPARARYDSSIVRAAAPGSR